MSETQFHDRMVKEIGEAGSSEQLEDLGHYIKRTPIFDGHEAIIEAWKEGQRRMQWVAGDPLGVIAHLENERNTQ